MYAEKLKFLNLNATEIEMVLRGLRDHALNLESQKETKDYQKFVQPFLLSRTQKESKRLIDREKKHVEDFLKRGGSQTKSGLAYKIKKAGNTKRPQKNDSIEIDYEGSLSDGTVFDSSIKRNVRAQLTLDSAIKGWQEAMTLIGEGGEIDLVVPPGLAYGAEGSPPDIPEGSTLQFTIKLHRILKNN